MSYPNYPNYPNSSGYPGGYPPAPGYPPQVISHFPHSHQSNISVFTFNFIGTFDFISKHRIQAILPHRPQRIRLTRATSRLLHTQAIQVIRHSSRASLRDTRSSQATALQHPLATQSLSLILVLNLVSNNSSRECIIKMRVPIIAIIHVNSFQCR